VLDGERSPEHLEGLADVRGQANAGLSMASVVTRGAAQRGAASGDLRVILPCRQERREKRTLRIEAETRHAGEPDVTSGLPNDV